MSWRWLFHAIHGELQVRYLFAKGANLLADFVKCLCQLRAEWACTALQLCIDDLHERTLSNQTHPERFQRFALRFTNTMQPNYKL